MFYPDTLTDSCCNSNVEIVDNSSYHVSWHAPGLPSYVVFQICQSLGIVVIDPFLEVPPEEVVTWVQVRGVGWPREVGATRNKSVTRKISAEEFQRSVWTIVWCSIFLVGSCADIYSPFPPQCRNELRPHECNVTVCFSFSSSKKYGLMMSFRPMAHHTVTLSWLRERWVCSCDWAWAQKNIFCLLMCPLKWRWVSSLKKIKCNKPGLFLIISLAFSQNVSRSAIHIFFYKQFNFLMRPKIV